MSERTGQIPELAADQDVRPCQHMEEMVSGYADGSLRGPGRWYTHLHMLTCLPCRAAAKNLQVVIGKLSDLRINDRAGSTRLSEERRSELERTLDEVDGSTHE